MWPANSPLGTTWTFGTTWTRGTTWPRGTTWTRKFAVALIAALLVASLGGVGNQDRTAATSRLVEVIVTRTGDVAGGAERAVVAAGGHVLRRLDVVDGFSALVPASRVPAV